MARVKTYIALKTNHDHPKHIFAFFIIVISIDALVKWIIIKSSWASAQRKLKTF